MHGRCDSWVKHRCVIANSWVSRCASSPSSNTLFLCIIFFGPPPLSDLIWKLAVDALLCRVSTPIGQPVCVFLAAQGSISRLDLQQPMKSSKHSDHTGVYCSHSFSLSYSQLTNRQLRGHTSFFSNISDDLWEEQSLETPKDRSMDILASCPNIK